MAPGCPPGQPAPKQSLLASAASSYTFSILWVLPANGLNGGLNGEEKPGYGGECNHGRPPYWKGRREAGCCTWSRSWGGRGPPPPHPPLGGFLAGVGAQRPTVAGGDAWWRTRGDMKRALPPPPPEGAGSVKCAVGRQNQTLHVLRRGVLQGTGWSLSDRQPEPRWHHGKGFRK